MDSYDLIMHELGHYIMARHCKIRVGELKLIYHSDGTFSGASKSFPEKPLPALAQVEQYVRNRFKVSIAGSVLQAFENGSYSQEKCAKIVVANGAVDYAQSGELLLLITGIEAAKKRNKKILDIKNELNNEIFCEVANFFTNHYMPIENVARKIQKDIEPQINPSRDLITVINYHQMNEMLSSINL